MKTLQLSVLLMIILLIGCSKPNNLNKKKEENNDKTVNKEATKQAKKEEVGTTVKVNNIELDGDKQLIKFDEFIIAVDKDCAWNEDGNLDDIKKDTVIVYVPAGISAENRKIQLKALQDVSLEISQRYVNRLIVSAGAICSPEYGKYYGEWTQLAFKEGVFTTVKVPESTTANFIDVDMQQLIKIVQSSCGDHFANAIKDIKSPYESDEDGLMVLRYGIEVKISFTDSSGIKAEKLLIFEYGLD